MKTLALLIAIVVTRWTLAPKYLFYIDNVNFALAIEHFNPALHQPQPPGYPLFVALLKLLHMLVPDVKYVELIAGAIGSLAALLLIRRLGDELFGAPAGWLSAAILFFHPAFWLAGIGNHVRTFLAAGACAVALCVWRAWQDSRWFYISAAVLGIAAGFRPELLALLLPLVFSTAVKRRESPAHILMAVGALAAGTLPWLSALAAKAGGFPALFPLLAGYLESQAGRLPAWLMAALAIYWTGLGVVSWIWAVGFIRRPVRLPTDRMLLLAIWFVPPFLFHLLVHVHDPDQTLVTVPITALLGGWMLAMLSWRAGAAMIAMAINAALFLVSPAPLGKDATYRWVKRVGSETTAAIDGIKQVDKGQPLLIMVNKSFVTSRQLSYYFPNQRVIDVSVTCAQLPAASRVIALPPPGPPFVTRGNLGYADLAPGTQFRIGQCQLTMPDH